MSKVRQNVPDFDGDLAAPVEGDLAAYVVFTQLKPDGPFIYAGWLDAADDVMALGFAREHYGQDQQCTALWAVRREHVHGVDPDVAPPDDAGPQRPFVVFRQRNPGDGFDSVSTIDATSPADATRQARAALGEGIHDIWVAEQTHLVVADENELIWRTTDQSYRLARGYSKDVREKWERIRKLKDIEDYEREDLKETF